MILKFVSKQIFNWQSIYCDKKFEIKFKKYICDR